MHRSKRLLACLLMGLLATACEKELQRSPPVRLPSLVDFRGVVTLDRVPLIRGAIIFGNSTLNVYADGWAAVKIPGKGAFAMWGPGRVELSDLQTQPSFYLWRGRMMVYAGHSTMEVVQGSVSTRLLPGSGGYFDRTRYDDYVCIGKGDARIDAAGRPMAVTGTGHRAFTQSVDGGQMYPAAVSWHSAKELNVLVALDREP